MRWVVELKGQKTLRQSFGNWSGVWPNACSRASLRSIWATRREPRSPPSRRITVAAQVRAQCSRR